MTGKVNTNKVLKELGSTYRENARLNCDQAHLYHQQGDIVQASIHYERAKLLYETVGDTQQAKQVASALYLMTREAMEYYNRAVTRDRFRQHNETIEDYTRAIELNPGLIEAYYGRGRAYNASGQYEKGINDFNKAIALHPQYSHAYNNRGYSYASLGQLQDAIEDFSSSVSIFTGRQPSLQSGSSLCLPLALSMNIEAKLHSCMMEGNSPYRRRT